MSSNLDPTARKLRDWTITKVVAVAVAFMIGFLFAYVIEKNLRDNWILPDNVQINGVLKPDLSYGNMSVREAYRSLNKVLSNVSKNKYPFSIRKRVIETAKTQKGYIEKIYPLPTLFSLLNRNTYPETKNRAWITFFLGFLVSVFPVAFLFYWDRKKLRPFFFQVGKIEPPIEKGKPINFIAWGMMKVPADYLAKMVNPVWYRDLMAIYDHQIIADKRIFLPNKEEEEFSLRECSQVVFNAYVVNEEIAKIVDELVEDGKKEGLITEENELKFRVCCAFALFHYTAGFFGNVPSEMIAITLKDPTCKAFISSYYYGKTFTLTSGGIFKEHLREVSDFLKVFHGYRKEKEDFLLKLKDRFCQIPLDTGFTAVS